jgi:hypothetical protein
MSAQFIVRFRGQPVKFSHQAGHRVAEIVPRTMASVFTAEADAWLAAHQHILRAEHVTVTSLEESAVAA